MACINGREACSNNSSEASTTGSRSTGSSQAFVHRRLSGGVVREKAITLHGSILGDPLTFAGRNRARAPSSTSRSERRLP